MSDGDRSEPTSGESSTDDERKRRRFLQLASGVSLGALAGCLQLGDTEGETEVDAGRPDNWCVEENNVEVWDELATEESIDGVERDPSDLLTREEVAYQCYPQGYQLCANCRFFIPGKPNETGSGNGACAIVEGVVRSRDYCARYEPTERLQEYPSPTALEQDGIQKAPPSN
jgi:hypothetical protein